MPSPLPSCPVQVTIHPPSERPVAETSLCPLLSEVWLTLTSPPTAKPLASYRCWWMPLAVPSGFPEPQVTTHPPSLSDATEDQSWTPSVVVLTRASTNPGIVAIPLSPGIKTDQPGE